MKAKELADILLRHPDFDVKVSIVTVDDEVTGFAVLDYKKIDIVSLADIGYSDKVIVLDGIEEDQ